MRCGYSICSASDYAETIWVVSQVWIEWYGSVSGGMTLARLAARSVVAGGDFFMPPLRRRARRQVAVLVHGAALRQRIGPHQVPCLLQPARRCQVTRDQIIAR
jgi:hypothetical protein